MSVEIQPTLSLRNHRISRIRGMLLLLSLMTALALLPGAATAVVPKEGNDSLDSLAFVSDRLSAPAVLEPVEEVEGELEPAVRDAWQGFHSVQPGEWRGYVDRRHGRLDSAEGAGIPFVPGAGNPLTREDIARQLGGKETPDLAALDRITRSFLPRVGHLLGVDARTLKLNVGRSGSPADYLWLVDYDVVIDGLPVEGARLVFRINHGNLIQFGTENLPSPHARVPKATVTREQALSRLSGFIGGFTASDTFLDGGSLHLLPVAADERGKDKGYAFGQGRELLSAWQFTFEREGDLATWRARVDAVTGEVIELRDINHYAQVTGGVRSLGIYPMPFANLLSSGGYSNSAGVFNWRSIVTSTLNGQYVLPIDNCGYITKTTDGNGNIPFGTSAGTDCSTPGSGGTGNTNATRTAFYHINRAKEIGRGWLPGNTWLNGQLMVNVNLTDTTCNAVGGGSGLYFYRSTVGCGNTGELEGILVHEFGHGFDESDGNGSSPDGGSGEAYADISAALTNHSSCIGPGFWTSNCNGYGDACTSCNGVRDIDWARHTSNTPHTADNFTRLRCKTSDYAGPCGGEGHCEAYVITEALWDFAARDLPSPGTASAWNVAERLWFLSRSTATSAFTCNAGSIPWTSNGCNTGSLWKTMRAVDDDNGNLADGTPHSANLYAAFNRHGIACVTDPGANSNIRGCTQPAVPTLGTPTAGYNRVSLSWSGSTGRYDVYRSDRSCNAGFVKIQNDRSTASYTDTAVANGSTYYYMVVAQPAGNEACASAPSICRTVSLPTASLEGYHDIATCRDIYGWAWDQNRPNTSVSVDIYKDDNYYTTVPASLFRQDLFNAGKGNGYHGFDYNPGSTFRDAQWHTMQVRHGGMATSLFTTPKSIICGVTINTNQTPVDNLDTAGQVYTVATQFKSNIAGEITHLRFWRAVGEGGTNVGKLWADGGGTPLGTVTFRSTPTSGWVEAELIPHVAISANTMYRVGVNTNLRQAKTGCGIGSGITRQNLTAYQGFWIAGDAFPTTSSCSNYFVDVKFDL